MLGFWIGHEKVFPLRKKTILGMIVFGTSRRCWAGFSASHVAVCVYFLRRNCDLRGRVMPYHIWASGFKVQIFFGSVLSWFKFQGEDFVLVSKCC